MFTRLFLLMFVSSTIRVRGQIIIFLALENSIATLELVFLNHFEEQWVCLDSFYHFLSIHLAGNRICKFAMRGYTKFKVLFRDNQ